MIHAVSSASAKRILAAHIAVALFFILCFVSHASAQQTTPAPPLITQPIDESQRTVLHGNTHPSARPQYDLGTAPAALPLQRMLLVLKRSPQQELALRKLLDNQQDKSSPSYHQWLTPQQFGQQFGPRDVDLETITAWLQSHGFQVGTTKGRTVLEFSGSASQVQEAFHTSIHKYIVNGAQHWANSTDPSIPTALTPAIAGIASLNNFPRHPMYVRAGTFSREKATGKITPIQPQFTFPSGCVENNNDQNACEYGLGPYDFATIYNLLPLWNTNINGTGQTIAIVAESNINPQDVADFRSLFDLPANSTANGNPLNIILNGPDPGLQGDETEADLDVQWSGAVAPYATLDFVVSQSTETTSGVDLSAVYIVDNNLAPVMSESYGACELALGTAGNQFYSTLWQQAATQGITVFISAGDGGAAGCDNFDASPPSPAEFGLQVSGYASTPYNVAVGGTDFNDFSNPATYWNLTNNSTTQASAKSYIPETTWNDSCTNAVFGTVGFSTNAETNCNNSQLIDFVSTLGGSGGVSNCTTPSGLSPANCSGGYAKPSWQTGTGVPNDGKRDIPDVSLFASNGFLQNFYIVCESDVAGPCSLQSSSYDFLGVGGTSASSPAFAGIMALVNQQTASRQGNANYVFYKLAAKDTLSSCNSSSGPASTCIFNDVTSGTNAMPCEAGSPNCTTSPGDAYGILTGYNAGTGYDQATGLGSVNADNLVTQWSSVSFLPSATTLNSLTPTTITHGQPVTFSVTVKPQSGTGTPTGEISLLGPTTGNNQEIGGFNLSSGTFSGTTDLLPGGTYSVSAHYPGDGNYAASTSNAMSVTVNKENSQPQVFLVTFNSSGNIVSSNTNTAVYGSPYLLRVNVENSAGAVCSPVSATAATGCPSGTVTMTDNGATLDAGTYTLNSFGYFEDQLVQLPGGTNSVKAAYAGDNSFNSSTVTSSIAITTAPTTTTAPTATSATVGNPVFLSITVTTQSTGVAPTGTVTFLSNGSPIAGTVQYSGSAGSSTAFASLNASLTYTPNAAGNFTLSVSYSGDANYQTSSSPSTTLAVKFAQPSVSLQSSASIVAAGSNVTLTAIVTGGSKTTPPTGTISFAGYEGTLPGTVAYSTITDPNTGDLDLQGTLVISPTFSDFYSAQYAGDANFPAAQTNGFVLPLTVTGSDFSLLTLPQQSSVTVVPGNNATLELLAGLQSGAAPVSFAANTCSGLPSESSCSINPNPVSSTGGFNVQIVTTAPHALASSRKPLHRATLWPAMLMPFAAVLLAGVSRRRWHAWASLVVLGLLLFLPACGGSGSSSGGGGGGGGGGQDPGTPAGNYQITVTGSSGSNTHTVTFTLIVQ